MERVDELAERLDRIEAELASIRSELRPLGSARPVGWAPPSTIPPGQSRAVWPAPTVPVPVAAASRRRTSEPLGLEAEQVLKWGGVGLVVLAIGFAVSTAISRGWIGRELQLAAALAASAALVSVGVRLRSTRQAWMHALCTGGVTGAAITVASPLLRDLTNESTSVAATVAVAVLSVLLALGVRSEWVLGAATVSGAIGWWASLGGDPDEYATGIWLALLLAGVVGLATLQRWYVARIVAWSVGAVTFVVAAVTAAGALDRWALSLAAGAFVVGWGALAGTASETTETFGLRRPAQPARLRLPSSGTRSRSAARPPCPSAPSDWRQLELILLTLVAPWTLLMTGVLFEVEGETALGWTALGLAAVSSGIVWTWRRHLAPERVVAMLIGSSVVTTIGLAALLDAAVTVLAIAVQGAGLVVLADRVVGGVALRVNGWVLLGAGALALAMQLIAAWEEDASVADDLVHATVIAVLALVAWKSSRRDVRAPCAVAVLSLSLGWLGSVLVHVPQGQALVSVSWAVVGTLLLIAGAVRKVPQVAQAALVVFGITSAKLLTVDLQAVDTLWRAGLFLIVGVVFLRLGFLLPRLTARPPAGDSDRDHPTPTTSAQDPPLAA